MTTFSLIRSVTVEAQEGSYLPAVTKQAIALGRMIKKEVRIIFNRETLVIQTWLLQQEDSYITERVVQQFQTITKKKYGL